MAADATPRPSRYGRWRAATLAGVYVLMALHIAHWKIAGRTLAPLELNEVMYTLELGVVTAGFLFMLVACAATLIFGRFFCGWGCHILALEDLCAWLLRKLRIRTRPVRSRLLLFVPLAAMLYMFVWPQVSRIAEGRPLPKAHVRDDAQGWASFQTTEFWRNLPGPGVALLTFGLCGFAIVYVLGSRSFCAYACPYGAVFRGLDRLSPGRIVAAGDCSQCGACTAACPSQIAVHEELQRFGTVVNAACVKDLECVSACPQGNVRYGIARPPLLRGWRSWRPIRRVFDFTIAEELLIAAVMIATVFIFRGLYDLVPFLMTLGLGAILATLAVCLVRLTYRPDVRAAQVWLRRNGRLTRSGAAFVIASAGFLGFAAHSAFIRYHEFTGYRDAAVAAAHAGSPHDAALAGAIRSLERCRRWGLLTPPRLIEQLGRMHARRGELNGESGDLPRALADLTRAAQLQPANAALQYNIGVMLAAMGAENEAIARYRHAAAIDPRDADVQNNLGVLLMQRGERVEAEACLRSALRSNTDHAHANFNLGRLLLATGRRDEAAACLQSAARLDPRYAALLSGPRPPG